jgi:hypothetical protein
MRREETEGTDHGAVIFADPVAYLANFGISAEVVEDRPLPAAA